MDLDIYIYTVYIKKFWRRFEGNLIKFGKKSAWNQMEVDISGEKASALSGEFEITRKLRSRASEWPSLSEIDITSRL